MIQAEVERCAGIDVGKQRLAVCIMVGPLAGETRVGKSTKLKHRFMSEVFARVWPCKIHGFGISSRPLVMGFPFHSVDASSWEIAPTAFGTWAGFNGARLSVRGSKQNLVSEVRHYLALERDARARWASEWAKLQESDRPIVRLAINRPHSWQSMGTI